MRIERTGDYLVIKDNYKQVKHFTPSKGLFVHKHPTDSNFILFSNTSKVSIKDAIRIDVSSLEKIGEYVVLNPSRAIALIYVSILLDESKSILDLVNYVDGRRLVVLPVENHYVESEELSEEPQHFFCSYDVGWTNFFLSDAPTENVSFLLTCGSLWTVFIKTSNLESVISYKGTLSAQQKINVGQTVKLDFNVETGIYTLTDL
jgi:hypothetical protein